ncbi:MAG: DUF1905 domain-containing protein [Chitinophagia bacterium]|nr:DUF1905 domain-containing protein [Chitinophagia bacterium]
MHPPLVNGMFVLEKYPGKGGWTYASLPGILPDRGTPFGWRLVRGTIDGYAIEKYHLMPSGNGALFLPVKAAIRKQIGKQAGDTVHIVLYAENIPTEMPAEWLDCLRDEPAAFSAYIAMPAPRQQQLIAHLYAATNPAERDRRLAAAIDQLAAGQWKAGP